MEKPKNKEKKKQTTGWNIMPGRAALRKRPVNTSIISPVTSRSTRRKVKVENENLNTSEVVHTTKLDAFVFKEDNSTFIDVDQNQEQNQEPKQQPKQEPKPGPTLVKIEHIAVEIEKEGLDSGLNRDLEHMTTLALSPAHEPNVFVKADLEDANSHSPTNWVKIYNEVVELRSKFFAPVDHQGCESMPNTITPNLKTKDPKKYRFQLLISLMLSSQTKDEVNYDAMVKLERGLLKHFPKLGFCLESMSKLSPNEIDAYIAKVGFHNRKAQYIQKACQILINDFNGDIPKTIQEIVKLPGVGPKMGYLLLQCGWGINLGIGVDVHLHRLAEMWHWVTPKASTPEKCRLELESWLPKKYWIDVNPLMVGFGQVICVPRAPNCDICSLGRKGLCKAADKRLLKTPISDARKVKLMKQRADLTNLIEEFSA